MADKRGRKKVTEKLPKGTILQDVTKVQWQIIEPIGQGGFGVIYSVKKLSSENKGPPCVAKVEPHSNGPLFVEKNFFMRNLQPAMLSEYKQQNKLQFLGLPDYLGGGSLTQNGVQHRFLVMERFGRNINTKLITDSGVDFKLLGKYVSQIIDSLKYLHDKGYAHMDVKPENLLLKYKETGDVVYLIDFGIVDRYTTEKEFKPDKKKQHNGTVLYTSRDSHQGVVTRRGDFEVLGYNILQWCGIELPWTKDVKNANLVFEKKEKFLSNIKKNLTGKIPQSVIDYFTYINNVKHNEAPVYDHLKLMFKNFETKDKTICNKKSPTKRRTLSNGDSKSDASYAVSPEKKKSKERKTTEDQKTVILNAAMQEVINSRNALKIGKPKKTRSSSVSEEIPKRRGRPKKA